MYVCFFANPAEWEVWIMKKILVYCFETEVYPLRMIWVKINRLVTIVVIKGT